MMQEAEDHIGKSGDEEDEEEEQSEHYHRSNSANEISHIDHNHSQPASAHFLQTPPFANSSSNQPEEPLVKSFNFPTPNSNPAKRQFYYTLESEVDLDPEIALDLALYVKS
jgi:ABC-type Zn2+ transport system substrate-binding protein/surface adhesin